MFLGMMLCVLMAAVLTSCHRYTAQNYVNDMKSLTEETIRNASNYTADNWKQTEEKFHKLNEKGRTVWKDLTEQQKEQLHRMSTDLQNTVSRIQGSQLRQQIDRVMQQVDEYVKGTVRR